MNFFQVLKPMIEIIVKEAKTVVLEKIALDSLEWSSLKAHFSIFWALNIPKEETTSTNSELVSQEKRRSFSVEALMEVVMPVFIERHEFDYRNKATIKPHFENSTYQNSDARMEITDFPPDYHSSRLKCPILRPVVTKFAGCDHILEFLD